MFPNATQAPVAHDLLAEAANSMSFQHAVLWVYGALGVFAVVGDDDVFARVELLDVDGLPQPALFGGPAFSCLFGQNSDLDSADGRTRDC